MSHPLRLGVACLCCISAGLFAACWFSPSRIAGGSGTENTNGTLVTARVVNRDGSPAANASIWIRPYDFLRDTGNTDDTLPRAQARTDADGYFSLDSLAEGFYALEASDGIGHALLHSFYAAGPYGELGVDTLREMASLKGTLEKPGGQAAEYVQIFGLDRVAKADSTGAFSFDSLPAGLLRIHAVSSVPGRVYRQPEPINLEAGAAARLDTLKLIGFADEDYAAWPFSRRLQVNTASLLAMDTLFDFPLLIRLDTSNFNFGLSSGKDLRFSKTDGRHLNYEIERWDADARQADVWVRIDTLRADPAGTYLNLYWGMPNAPDFSSGASVFVTFTGAWHMRESVVNGVQAAFTNAAPNGKGVAGPIDAGDRSGAVGLGAKFAGAQYLKTAGSPELMPARIFTVSAWIKSTAIDSQGGEIASMGDNYGIRISGSGIPKIFVFKDSAWTGTAQPPVTEWASVEPTTGWVLDGRWHFVAGVLDGKSMRLYLDGNEAASLAYSGSVFYRLGKDFWIGKHGNGLARFDFMGGLDEIEFSRVARSAGWIKFSFENQKPGATLIQFK